MLGNWEVQRVLPPGPTTEREFLTYIRWARRARRIGRHLSFGVVPHGFDTAVGLFQLWALEPSFRTVEWGFALGPPFWGTGLFMECAERVVDFAVDWLGVRRLEARVAVDNVCGSRALQKLGAVHEGVLRQCFECDGRLRDHVMWAILSEEWHQFRNTQHERCDRVHDPFVAVEVASQESNAVTCRRALRL